jgi:hypothetical protein
MRINDILIESDQLQEGPILNKIGSGLGKAAGTVAKGIGAVAGGVSGAVDAAKKGFAAGKQAVAGAGDEVPTTAADINAQGPKGTAAAKTQTGAGAQAIQKTAQAAGGNAEKAGQTLYAQVKSQVNQLDKKGKSRIMQLLQKSLQQTPAATAPAADPAATANTAAPTPGFNSTAADATTQAAPTDANVAAPDNTMANTAAADVPDQPQTKKRGGRVAGAEPSQTPDAIRKRNSRRDKKNAATTTGGAGVFNQMGQQLTKQNASKDNLGNPLAEALARQIKVHKQKMYEQVSAADSFNIFRKK